MESTNAHLSTIKSSFPQHAERIESLYNSNTDFRALCEDYYLCMEISRKARQDFSKEQDRLAEYNQLTAELEKELLAFIKRNSQGT